MVMAHFSARRWNGETYADACTPLSFKAQDVNGNRPTENCTERECLARYEIERRHDSETYLYEEQLLIARRKRLAAGSLLGSPSGSEVAPLRYTLAGGHGLRPIREGDADDNGVPLHLQETAGANPSKNV